MQKPKNRNGRPSSPLKAAMALWAERRIPVSHLPSEAPDSVYEPLEEAASEAEQGFASESSRDWQEFRLKFETALWANSDYDYDFTAYWIEGLAADVRRLAGPMS